MANNFSGVGMINANIVIIHNVNLLRNNLFGLICFFKYNVDIIDDIIPVRLPDIIITINIMMVVFIHIDLYIVLLACIIRYKPMGMQKEISIATIAGLSKFPVNTKK